MLGNQFVVRFHALSELVIWPGAGVNNWAASLVQVHAEIGVPLIHCVDISVATINLQSCIS